MIFVFIFVFGIVGMCSFIIGIVVDVGIGRV